MRVRSHNEFILRVKFLKKINKPIKEKIISFTNIR